MSSTVFILQTRYLSCLYCRAHVDAALWRRFCRCQIARGVGTPYFPIHSSSQLTLALVSEERNVQEANKAKPAMSSADIRYIRDTQTSSARVITVLCSGEHSCGREECEIHLSATC